MGKVIACLIFELIFCSHSYCQNCSMTVCVDNLLWQYIRQVKDTVACYIELNVLFENRGNYIDNIDLSSNDFFWKKEYEDFTFDGYDAPFENLSLLLDTDTLILSAHWSQKNRRKLSPQEVYKVTADISLYTSMHNQFYLQHTHSKRSIRKYIRHLHKNGTLVFVHGDHMHKAPLSEAKVEYNEWLLW